ncbi:MAG: CRISPR-associated endonuclease Cas2 [Pirellulaceae bacterium]|nr:CRISPR-associated endonuclease Cas2 [Pirellulaceae bacterium]
MRHSFIVCYDIRDAKRLRKVYRTMRNWGDHLQYSVFHCQLAPPELLECRTQLSDIIHHDFDQILFIDIGSVTGRHERVIESLGQPYSLLDSNCFII